MFLNSCLVYWYVNKYLCQVSLKTLEEKNAYKVSGENKTESDEWKAFKLSRKNIQMLRTFHQEMLKS